MTDEAEALRIAAVVDLAQRAHDFSGEPVELFVRDETLDGVPHIRIVTDPASILLPVSAARIVFGALLPPAPVLAGAGDETDEERLLWRSLTALRLEVGSEIVNSIREYAQAALKAARAGAPPSGGMTEGARTKLCADLHIWADAADEGDRIAYAYANGAPCPDVISQMGADIRKAIGVIEALSGNADALSASPAPASGTDEVEQLRAKLKEAHDTIDQLRAIRPQAFILSRASEWSRLFREVHGYLRTCHGKHGTDWDGRQHAMNALEIARQELEAASPSSLKKAREDGE